MHRGTTAMVLLALALLTGMALIAGCGGSGGEPEQGPAAVKFDEFIGDGGGAAKPLPDFLDGAADDADKRLPTPLRLRRVPVRLRVPEGRVNWFDADLQGVGKRFVCLIQPPNQTTNMADPDLYVLYPLDDKAQLNIPEPSRRAPVGGVNPPDWVSWEVGTPGSHQIGVVGYSAAGAVPPTISFDMELDRSRELVKDAPAVGVYPGEELLAQTDSNWLHFQATAGVQHTVSLQTLSGDADLYVYGATSSSFIGQSRLGGTTTDQVQFTPATTGLHHIRVYGYSQSDYRIQVTTAGGGGPGTVTRRAVVVGISDYVGTVNDLTYCDNDALDFAAALGAWSNWNPANITTIVDRNATAANIWAALNAMSAASDADDQCVFFFSGHGGRGSDYPPVDEADGMDEYLCETDLTNNITDDQLGNWVAGLPTENVMIVLCACYSGGAFKDGDAIKSISPARQALDGFVDEIRAAMASRVRTLDVDDAGAGVVLAACDDNETCQESSALGHDVFNHYVLQAMGGAGDADSNGTITAEEIFAYANPLATAYNPRQHAQLYDARPAVPFVLLY